MSSEDDLRSEANAFIEELFVSGDPLRALLRTGHFPAGWPERYLAFVDRVLELYPPGTRVPHEVMAVIYTVSVYCTKRYLDWQRLAGGSDEVTEQMVNKVRWAGDQLIMSPYYKLGSSSDS